MSPITSTLFFLTLVIGWASAAKSDEHPLRHFIVQRDGKLFEGDDEFRFVSWNIPNLHNVEDAFEFLGTSPWRWPDEFEIADALESVKQMGGQVVRTYVISVKREGGDMGDNVHVVGPGQFNEEAFKTLDLVLKVAGEKGIRVIIPLVDNWHWWGGVREYEGFRGKSKGDFWTDPQVFEDFEKTIRFIVNRRNTLTGRLYRDDKAIFGWETGNELDAPPAWTKRVAATLKRLDPKHLVIDGRSLHGVPRESLEDPNIDIITTHHYHNVGNNNADNVVEAAKIIDGKKAYFVGEFGFLSVSEAGRFFDAVIDEGVSGALYWSLRFHRREGGFYWHHEPSGDDLFKAYHWPGFPEGVAYRENQVVPMVRSAAYRIRGLKEPAPPIPLAPRMLPLTAPGVLTWQGSAGASGYDVQRAKNEMGPWCTVAENLSDAAYQYRPLYCDENAKPGIRYYYRTIARNALGASSPSNTVGPSIADTRLFVDELQDKSRFHASSGAIELRSGNARTTQEDTHRLGLSPGASVTYRMPGPIQSCSVWLFCEHASQKVELVTSLDGKDYKPQEQQRQEAPPSGNDYGYLRPVLISADVTHKGARFLKLSLPKSSQQFKTEISRIEFRYRGQDD